jgi:hypothetical protein
MRSMPSNDGLKITQPKPKPPAMISAEELVGEEWAEWYRLTPAQRWTETSRLWQTYLALGGSLDPEPETQSPFFDARV